MPVTQTSFAAALLDPSIPAPDELSDGKRGPAGRRFDVYRNNVTVSLIQALKAAFPIVTRMLGVQNIDRLARQYVQAHPPRDPLMMHFGGDFPRFLAHQPQLEKYGYLPDAARLELAIRRSYHAADCVAADVQELAALPPESLMKARVSLAPALCLLRSDWPLFDLWLYNTAPGAPKPRGVPQDVVVLRPEFDPTPHLLPAGGADWIDALRNGANFELALDTAQRGNADFDLGACLTLLTKGGGITAITSKEPAC